MSALSLAPRALYEEVAELLRQRIFARELEPGSWIDEVKIAEAYGHVGMLIERPEDVEPALREARAIKDRTVFLDFRTDPTENVWPMVEAGKGITEMLLGSEEL